MSKSAILREADLLELSREIIKKGNSIRFQAKGWSMRPFIQDGDFITVCPIEDSSVKIGNVIFYLTAENNIIVHRIIKKYKKSGNTVLSVKGDASFSPAEKVDLKNVLGAVKAVERNGQKKRLDTRSSMIKGRLIAGISPLSRWIYPMGSTAKQIKRKISGRA